MLGLDHEPTLRAVSDRVYEAGLPGEFDFELYGETLEGESLDQAFEGIQELARRHGIREAVCIVQYPSWEPLARRMRERHGWRIVYDCLDDHTGFGTHGPNTARDEGRLIRESDLVTATSRPLLERIRAVRPDVLHLPNAADAARFGALPARESSPLARLPRPVVGYYGAIAEWFDVDAVAQAASRRPDWSFVLVGRADGSSPGRLDALRNIHRTGEVPYENLGEQLTAFDVCTIPFRRTPLTEATNPVKLYEYLATGKPVVARRLPEIEPFSDLVELYDSPAEFGAALERALSRRPDDVARAARRREIALENTWSIRYRALRERLDRIPTRHPATSPGAGERGPGPESASSALGARIREIRRLDRIVSEQAEGIHFLRAEAAVQLEGMGFLRGEVARRDQVLADTSAALRSEIDRIEAERARIAAESEQRRRHLEEVLAELERWDRSRLGRLRHRAQRLRAAAAAARRAVGEATAPGTPLFAVGRRLIPRPVARWMRRTLAPVAAPDALVRLEPGGGSPPFDAVPAEPRGRYDAIVFSIIDWDFRFQRPQQLATQFGRHGHRVLYLSTTRFLAEGGPAWDLARKAENVGELRIRSRRALDVYGGSLDDGEVDILAEAFEAMAADLAMGDAVCLVQIPFWAPLAERLRERMGWRIAYDCMDEWTNFPGFGSAVLTREESLVRGADATIVSADRLHDKWSGVSPRLILAKNGIDGEHYRSLYGENDLLGGVSHPVIGYYGALASWVDVPLLEKIAARHPQATIVLAGGHFDVDLSPLSRLPNVRLLGQRPYAEMPGLLWNFDACIIPFLVNDITEATNPVKFYEYLYGGKPVVAPALTELLPYESLAYLARGHEDFLAKIDAALAEPANDPRRAARRRVAEENDWARRYETIASGLAETFPLVSVIVVTYGGLELTRACMESLLSAETWPRLEVLVVDNASGDGTPDYLRALAARDARVRCILNAENRGFAAANNQGIAESLGDVLVLLNNDTVVPPGLIGRLAAHLERDRSIGLLCPTTNFCGNEARVEPDYSSADLSGLPAFAARRARDYRGRVFDIGVAAMYCVAMRRGVAERVGPLDEAYGVGMFEDDDFAVRMRQVGFRVACAEDAYVHHVGQGAFRKLSPADYDALWKKNQAYFEKKWGVAWKAHTPRDGVAAVASKVGVD